MKALAAAFWTESLKVRKSKIFLITIIFYSFIALMMGVMMYASQHPEFAAKSDLLSTKASFISDPSWISFYNLLFQVILTMGTIGIGIITSWTFGREYSDRVIKDILALPVSRVTIVNAKFLVILIWNIILTLVFFIIATLIGLAIKLTEWDLTFYGKMLRIFLTTSLLNSLLCTLVSFCSSIGRGFLLPIGFVVLTLMIPQFIFIAAPGIARFVPWAIPAFYCNIAGPSTPDPGLTGYIVFIITILTGLFGTWGWWRYADQK